MGKTTGFLEYGRINNSSYSPYERIKNYDEFHGVLSEEERRQQGARCMNCGVPFCQSGMVLGGMSTGCPLHNLIPEWNDAVFNGNWKHALSRLLKTNNFPEFTGRVCPALCECACTCGLHGSSVTVKENELAIIEKGFEEGWVTPHPPEIRTDKKVAVIGSGPSGLAVADRLNKRGHNVTVFEKDDRPGGLLMYGIPNMKLDKKIVLRRIDLMMEEGVKFVTDFDASDKKNAQKIIAEFDAVVLCCGAGQPRQINAEGIDSAKGVYFAVDFLRANTKSLLDSNLKDGKNISAKGKNVVIVGGGDTGNDCVGTVIRQKCKSVVQLEMMPKPLEHRSESNPWPEYPKVLKTDYGQQEAIAVFGHDPRMFKTTVKKLITDDNGSLTSVVTAELEPVFDKESGRTIMKEIEGSEKTLPADILIIAAGFTGCRSDIADAFGVKLSPRNTLLTDDSFSTTSDKIFAAGDARRGQSLVVNAIAEGRSCAKQVDKFLMGYTNMI